MLKTQVQEEDYEGAPQKTPKEAPGGPSAKNEAYEEKPQQEAVFCFLLCFVFLFCGHPFEDW